MTDERYTLTRNRYEIGDDCCGVVGFERTKSEAFKTAQRHYDRHCQENDERAVYVYDLMTQKSAVKHWTHDGKPVLSECVKSERSRR